MGLLKSRKKLELTDTFLQLGLLKMAKNSIHQSNIETINEIKDMKI